MQVQITVDGETVEHDVSLDFETLTLKQSVRLEKVMGSDRVARLLDGDGKIAMLASTIQALCYVQLIGTFPDLKLDDFDLDLTELVGDVDDENDEANTVVPLAMVLPDGSEIEGASGDVDPTLAAGSG